MNEYHKIHSLYKRDPTGKTVLFGQLSRPEFDYLWNNRWIFTEKVDGTNIRVLWDGVSVRFGGKTDAAQTPWDLVEVLKAMFPAEAMAKKFPETGEVCLYGEGYGAGIQKGGVYRPDKSFVLFDVKVGRWWLRREDVEEVGNALGVDVVPIVARAYLEDMVDMVKRGFNSQWGDFPAEGIVARPEVELLGRDGGRIIVKLKHKDFNQ